MWDALVDLVLPAGCAGCGGSGTPLSRGVCRTCIEVLARLTPHPVRPTPAPPGLPPCAALGSYDGVLRELILAYKEHGRHGLAVPLGGLLAQVVAGVSGGETVLVPVPATAAATRRRFGDHMRRLAGHAAARLRAAGRPASVANPLRALPRPDSVGLSSAERLALAADSFRVRAPRLPPGAVVVVDDLITTGGTAAAVTARLAEAGLSVHAVAVLAATARRTGGNKSTRNGTGTGGDAEPYRR